MYIYAIEISKKKNMLQTIDKVLKTSIGDVLTYFKSLGMKGTSKKYMEMLEEGFSSMEISSTYENCKGAIIDYYYDNYNVKINVDAELGEMYEKDWIIIRAYDENGELLFEGEGNGSIYVQPYFMAKVSESVLWYIDNMFREHLKEVN